MTGEDGGVFFLAAEGSAGFSLDDADLVVGEGEDGFERAVDVEGALEGAADGDRRGCAVGEAGGFGDDAVGFDVELLLGAGVIFAFDDKGVRIGSKGGVDVAVLEVEGFEGIVFAPDDFLEREGVFDGEDGGLGGVGDGDGGDGGSEGVSVGVGEEQDGLFGVVDAGGCE